MGSTHELILSTTLEKEKKQSIDCFLSVPVRHPRWNIWLVSSILLV